MKKIYLSFIIICYAFISIANATSIDQSSPKNTVITFFEALKEGNTEKVGKLLCYFGENSELEEKVKSTKDDMSDIKNIKVIKVSYYKDKTRARVTFTYDEGSSKSMQDTIRVINLAGRWFIDLRS